MLDPQPQDSLAMTISPIVLKVLALAWVNTPIGLIVRACVAIFNDTAPEDNNTRWLLFAIQTGVLIGKTR